MVPGPRPVIPITVTVNGKEYQGTYYVQQHMVQVQSEFGKKASQVGGSPPETLAKLLLSELVRKIG